MCRQKLDMHTKTSLLAILVIVMAITLVTAGSLAANAEAVKTKIKHSKRSSTRGTSGGSTGTGTLGGTGTGTTGGSTGTGTTGGSTGTGTTGGSTGTGTTGGPGSL